jgi:hypothetical protein
MVLLGIILLHLDFNSYLIKRNAVFYRNACYHSVQSLLSSRLLSRNVKVKIYKNHNSTSRFVWV